MTLVLVEYEFEYKTSSGRLVSIKPNEKYVLVSKSNEHWWHVRRDQHTRPFYVPAQYVKELSAQSASGSDESESAECVAKKTPRAIRASAWDDSRETYRFSTFGLCVNVPDSKRAFTNSEISSGRFSVSAGGVKTENQRCSDPWPVDQPAQIQQQPQDPEHEPTEQTQTFLDDEDVDFPLPPPPMSCMVPEIKITESESCPDPTEFVAPPNEPATKQQQEESSDQTAGTILKTETQVTLFLLLVVESVLPLEGAILPVCAAFCTMFT